MLINLLSLSCCKVWKKNYFIYCNTGLHSFELQLRAIYLYTSKKESVGYKVMYFWAKITPKRNFWGKLHLYHCCLFIVPYHAWKVEKLSYSRCWNGILPTFDQKWDPLILACVILGHNQANIAHVIYLKNSFWQIWIKSKLFYSIFCAFLWCKIREKSFRWIFKYNLA